MPGDILTLNAGSSSLKAGLFRGVQPLLFALAERIGEPAPALSLRDAAGTVLARSAPGAEAAGDHSRALTTLLALLEHNAPGMAVTAVGHRIVHGGTDYTEPVIVDDAVEAGIERLAPFAPLHQPHNLAGLRAARRTFPHALQVVCFDTAFHRTQSRVAETFALPREWFDRGVRRYGFHGLSYEHIAETLARDEPALAAGRVVVAHLGNGASLCAMHNGRSQASTMGFTALDGLPMGTRSGQIDPGVLLHLMSAEGMDAATLSDLLYKRSGLLGLSGGLSNDMRTLEASDAPEAAEAIAYFCDRIRRGVAEMAAAMGGIDGLVFTAGIGEHSARIRAGVCEGLGWLGLDLDPAANAAQARAISTAQSRIAARVIPTDEEGVLARAAVRVLSPHT